MDKDTLFYKKRTIRCNNRIIELTDPLLMGILNLTPDSFYDGGKHSSPVAIEAHVRSMLDDGADIIDIGGYSSRPGAKKISEKQELERIEPSIDMIRTKFPGTIISLDTYRAGIAAKVIEKYNIDIVNDISAGNIEPEILDVVAEKKIAYIAMHMQGTPVDMQEKPTYSHVVKDIIEYFAEHLELLQKKKITDIIIDPGFGFGKTIDQNYQLLAGLDTFKIFEFPILVGISRKSMIHNFLKIKPEEALAGSISLNMIALQQGANILRVHDVKEAYQTINLHKKILEESEKSINLLNKTEI